MIYYFAYGSNMDEAQMQERCPESKLLGKAVINGYKLAFTIYSPRWKGACADIIKDDSSQVWGVLYSVTEKDLERLDGYENIKEKMYKRITIEVINASEKIQAQTYDVVNKLSDIEKQKPSVKYISQIISSAERFSFPKEYQDMLRSIQIQEEVPEDN